MSEKMKVVICPGHYPAKPGAQYYGLSEHTEAKKVVNFLMNGLKTKFDVFTFIGSLSEKIDYVKSLDNVVLALDVHFNADDDDDTNDLYGRGTEVLIGPYCKNNKTVDVATSIGMSISTILGIPNRGVKPGWYKMDNNKKDVDAFVRDLPDMGLIIEILFMDNKAEYKMLLKNEHMKMASAIALGIQRSFAIELAQIILK